LESQVFGAHTFGFAFHQDAEATIDALIAHGFSTLELMATPPHYNPWSASPALQSRLRSRIERADIRLLALDFASSDINLASPAPEVIDFAVESYFALIERSAELGAEAICVGSGRRHMLLPKVNTALFPGFRAAFERIFERANRAGLKTLIENHPQGLLASAHAIRDFIAAGGYEGCGVIYDVANGFAIGENPVEGLQTLGDLTRIVHLSDAPSGQWRHDAIGSGDIDFAAILAHLDTAGFREPIVLEILADDPMAGLVDGSARLQDLPS